MVVEAEAVVAALKVTAFVGGSGGDLLLVMEVVREVSHSTPVRKVRQITIIEYHRIRFIEQWQRLQFIMCHGLKELKFVIY